MASPRDSPPPSSPPPSPGSTQPAAEADTLPGAQIGLAVSGVFVMGVGQMSTMPILAPLARAADLPEWQIGVLMSVAAMMLVITGPSWGKRAGDQGSKPLMVGSLIVGAAATWGFAAMIGLALADLISGAVLVLAMLALRGVLFGGAMAAMMPAAQTYVATVTLTERARVGGMARIGAAQAMAMLAGSALGGGLALFGIITPLVVVPVIILAMAALIAARLQSTEPPNRTAATRRLSPFDSRILPFLLAGFGMFTALGFIQLLFGFLIADRYDFTSEVTATWSGASIFAAGIGMLIAQGVIVPRVGWSPPRLLFVGTTIAALAFLVLIPTTPLPVLLAGSVMSGAGIGMAMPGFTSGPTLVVQPEERGAAVGLVTATMGSHLCRRADVGHGPLRRLQTAANRPCGPDDGRDRRARCPAPATTASWGEEPERHGHEPLHDRRDRRDGANR